MAGEVLGIALYNIHRASAALVLKSITIQNVMNTL